MPDGQALNTSEMRKNLLLYIIKSLPSQTQNKKTVSPQQQGKPTPGAIHQETLHMVCRVIADRLDKAHLLEDPFHTYFFRRDYRTAYSPLLDEDIRYLLTEGLIEVDKKGNLTTSNSHEKRVSARLRALMDPSDKKDPIGIITNTVKSVLTKWDNEWRREYFPATEYTGYEPISYDLKSLGPGSPDATTETMSIPGRILSPQDQNQMWIDVLVLKGRAKKKRFLLGNWHDEKEIKTHRDVDKYLIPHHTIGPWVIYGTILLLFVTYCFIILSFDVFAPSILDPKSINEFWTTNINFIFISQLAILFLAFTPVMAAIQLVNRTYGAVVYRWFTMSCTYQFMVNLAFGITILVFVVGASGIFKSKIADMPLHGGYYEFILYPLFAVTSSASLMTFLLIGLSLWHFGKLRYWMDARGMLGDVLHNMDKRVKKGKRFVELRFSALLKSEYLKEKRESQSGRPVFLLQNTPIGRQSQEYIKNMARERLESSRMFAHIMRRLHNANNPLQFGNCLTMLKSRFALHMQRRRLEAKPISQIWSKIMSNQTVSMGNMNLEQLDLLAEQICDYLTYSYTACPRALFDEDSRSDEDDTLPDIRTSEQWWHGMACEDILQSAIQSGHSHSVTLVIDALMEICGFLVSEPAAYPWVWTTHEFGHILFSTACIHYPQEGVRLALVYGADQFFHLLNSSMDTYFRKEMSDFIQAALHKDTQQFPLLVNKYFERRIQIVEYTMRKIFSAVLCPCMLAQMETTKDTELFRKYLQNLYRTYKTTVHTLLDEAKDFFAQVPPDTLRFTSLPGRRALYDWLLNCENMGFRPNSLDERGKWVPFARQASTRLRRLTESFCGSVLELGMQLVMNNHESLLTAYMEILLSQDVQILLGIMDQFVTAIDKKRFSEFGAYTFDETYAMTHLWEFFIRFAACQYNRFTDEQKNVLLNKNIVALYHNLRPWEPAWKNTLLQVKARLESLPDSPENRSALAEIDDVTTPPKPKQPSMLRRQTLLCCPHLDGYENNLGRIIHSHHVLPEQQYTITRGLFLERMKPPCAKCAAKNCFIFYINDAKGNFEFRKATEFESDASSSKFLLTLANINIPEDKMVFNPALRFKVGNWTEHLQELERLRKGEERSGKKPADKVTGEERSSQEMPAGPT